MSKKEMVGGVPGAVLGMLADLNLKLRDEVITPEELERFVKRQNPFLVTSDILTDWQNFYRDVFGVSVDLSGVKVPEKRRGFDRSIVVAKGMSPERVFQKMKEFFNCWKYSDKSLDEIVFDTDGVERKYRRSDHEDYFVWVRDRVEADEELKNRSANDLAAAKISGITLEARELYEFKYFKETVKHLDLRNWTLCTGSRDVDGDVPGVRWDGGGDRLVVHWCLPDSASGVDLRSREAVS